MRVTLDERLQIVSALVPACEVAADIGADHGFLGAWLLEAERCRRVQLCDVSAPSLDKARRLIDQLDLHDRVTFSVGDGLEALREPAQAIVLAGMGGPTIAGILERGKHLLHGAKVIMQPNVGLYDLRLRLMQTGFRIVEEEIARAAGRHYVVLSCVEGEASYTERELMVGPILLRDGHPLMASYANFRLRVAKKAALGAEKSDEGRAQELKREAAVWEEVLSCL